MTAPFEGPINYHEYKFFIAPRNLSLAQGLLKSLYGGTDPYPVGAVNTIYYDSDDRCYHECADGLPVKRKFRIRGYDGSKFTTAQVKNRTLTGVTKYRARLSHLGEPIGNWRDLFPHLKGMHSEFQSLAYPYRNLQPALQVRYLRQRFRLFDYRITFDTEIRFNSVTDANRNLRDMASLPGGVLEVKSPHERPHLPFLGFIRTAPTSFSKFYLGSMLLRNERTDLLHNYFS